MLARLVVMSPVVAVLATATGIALAVTVLVRKTDYVIFGWFVFTTFLLLIQDSLPAQYHSLVGTGGFWGGLICIVVAWAVENILTGRRFLPLQNMPLKVTAVLFLLWATMSLAASQSLFVSVKNYLHIVLALLAAYMFYNFFSRSVENIRKVIGVVTVIIIPTSCYTLLLAGHAVMTGEPIYKQIALWMFNPNSLGYFLLVTGPVIIVAGLDSMRNKPLKLVLVMSPLTALFLSFSRASWVGAFASYCYLLWVSRRSRMYFAPLLVAGLFVVTLLVPDYGGEFFNYVTGERYTGRKEIWAAALETACDYPLLGTGLGTAFYTISDYIETPFLKGQDAHSLYLKNAVEMGFPSMIIVVAFYLIFFYYAIRIENRLKSDYLKRVTRGAIAVLIGLSVHDFFEVGVILTAFAGAEFTVIWPYILMGFPFAAERLDVEAADHG